MSNYVSITTIAAAAYAAWSGDPRYLIMAAASGYGDYQRGNTRISGPKLSDLSFGTSQYGEPIIAAWGAPRLPGQVWWASDKRGTTTTQGGKGGPQPEVETTTYTIDLLIGLTDDRAARLSRIWWNGTLVWTRKSGASAESLAASDGSDLWSRLTFYPGTDTQMPDPTYEAAVGADRAPAYRGRSYVFIEALNLGQSGVMPNLQFEVLTAGDYAIDEGAAGPSTFCKIMVGTPAGVGATTMRVAIGQWDAGYSNSDVKVFDFDMLENTLTQVGLFSAYDPPNERPTTGTSDRPVLVTGGLSIARIYTLPGGGMAVLDLGHPGLGVEDMRWAISGDDIVIGTAGFSITSKLWRHSTAGGMPAATSGTLPDAMASIAIIDSLVYCAGASTGTIYVYDLATLTLQDSFDAPYPDTVPALFSIDGVLGYVRNTTPPTVFVRSQDEWANIGSIPSGYGPDTGAYATICATGGYLCGGKKIGSEAYGTWSAKVTASPGALPVAEVVDAICRRAGMPEGSWDTSDLTAIERTIRSFAVARTTSARAMLEQLGMVYFFDAVLRDKLYFRRIGQPPVMTIDYDDLGTAVDRGDDQALAITYASDIEIPPQVALTYANLNADHESGTEYSDRMVSTQAAVETIEVAIGMTPDEAKAVVDAIIARRAVATVTAILRLPVSYTQLDPGDAVVVPDDQGHTYTFRLQKRKDERGVLEFEAVRDDEAAVPGVGVTDVTQEPYNEVQAYADMVVEPLDIPLLRDADEGAGWYAAGRGDGTPWAGGTVQISRDDYVFSTAAQITESAVLGVTTTTLANYSGVGWDEQSSVTVDIGPGEAASSTRAAMAADITINTWLIGDEILRARNATMVSAGVYTLTGLLRGLQGTEWAMGLHATAERAVQLQARGLRRVSEGIDQQGLARFVRGVSLTKSAADVVSEPFTNTNVGLRPLAPVNLRVSEQPGQDLAITWSRRSRLQAVFLSSQGVPLGEDSEAYAVRIYAAGSPRSLLRTISAATTSTIYTKAMQVADGVTSGDQLEIDVAQISATVGEGRAATRSALATAQSLPQISKITVGGTFEAGAVLRATVAGTDYTYTTLIGDTNKAGVATAFAAVIDAAASYSAVSDGNDVIVTGPPGAPFSLAATVVPGDNVAAATITQAAAYASPGEPFIGWVYVFQLVTGNVDPIPPGIAFNLRVEQPSGTLIGAISYTTSSAETRADVHAALGSALLANDALYDAGYSYTTTYLSGIATGRIVSPTGAVNVNVRSSASAPYSLDVGIENPGSAAIPLDLAQESTVYFTGTCTTGWRYRVTLGGTNYTYTALAGDDMTDVAAGVAALIDASADHAAVANGASTSTSAQIDITAAAVGVSWSISAKVLPSTLTLSTSTVQAAEY